MRCAPCYMVGFWAKGEEMQFEIDGKQYFLTFVEQQGRWLLFTPARDGFESIPVVDDDAVLLKAGTMRGHGAGQRKTE